jgi:hypothetical protein
VTQALLNAEIDTVEVWSIAGSFAYTVLNRPRVAGSVAYGDDLAAGLLGHVRI